MDAEEKHIIYSAEEIQKYFSGKLEPAEMHAMERAALDDAFLAEAIEGYEGMQQQDMGNLLTSLKNDLSKKQATKVIPIIPAAGFGMWKAAAAVLLICSGIAIIFTLTRNKPTATSIAAVPKTPDSTTNTIENMRIEDTSVKPTAPAMEEQTNPAREKPLLAQAERKSSTSSVSKPRPGIIDKEIVTQDAGGRDIDDRQKGKSELSVNSPSPVAEQQLQERKDLSSNKASKELVNDNYSTKQAVAMNNKFIAQVVSPEGEPLPFANISIAAENFGTYSDVKGNFRLVSSDSLLNIEIKSVGYNSRSVVLRSDISLNKIVLDEDQLAFKDKVVVTRKAPELAKKRKSILEPSAPIEVEPADGWDNYDTYIMNNLALPNSIAKKNIHGEVEVSFDVQSDGALANLKIDKSLCKDCDDAALRVIKEGPRWKVKKGNKATGKVKVRF